jgi:DNA-binding FrmR family transcriptional regulator
MTTNQKVGSDHKLQLTRVNRIEGQIGGIKRMIEGEKYCVEILTQIKAVRSALRSLELNILEGHANGCLMKAVESGSKKVTKEKVDEIMELLRRSSKS